MTPENVASAEDFCKYAERVLGLPYTRVKDINMTRSQAKELFQKHPTLTWASLCRVVDWMRARKKRIEAPWMAIPFFRWAWKDGVLPELNWSDNTDDDLETRINGALEKTTDPKWRKRLIVTQGIDARKKALEDWQQWYDSTLLPSPPKYAATANMHF